MTHQNIAMPKNQWEITHHVGNSGSRYFERDGARVGERSWQKLSQFKWPLFLIVAEQCSYQMRKIKFTPQVTFLDSPHIKTSLIRYQVIKKTEKQA